MNRESIPKSLAATEAAAGDESSGTSPEGTVPVAPTFDARANRALFDLNFIDAAKDYRMLLDKGYPVDATLKLVGDRFRLTHNARMLLYRGILPTDLSRSNHAKLVRALWEEAELAVDGYNVLFTLTNYLHGHPMFIATDGFLRDVGGAHGRIADHRGFERMADIMVRILAEFAPRHITFFLDAPVSSSGRQAAWLRDAFVREGLDAEVRLENGVDHFLAHWEGELIATADSAIIAAAKTRVFDLARVVLERRFGAEFPCLAALLNDTTS